MHCSINRPAAVGLSVLAAMIASCTQPAEKVESPQPAQPLPAAPATPPAPPVGYACESGQTVTVAYSDTATAQVTYKNAPYVMRTVQAASGARYAGSGLEWWTETRDGQEVATLSRLGPNEDVGVAVLERCSRPAAGVANPPGPAPMPTPAPGGMLPAAASCRGPQLRLSADGSDAGAGSRQLVVGITNVGLQPCSLTGFPTVALQDARGRNLTAIRADQNPGSYFANNAAPQPVTLAPQGKAFVDISWNVVPHEAQGERTCPSAARIRMTAPGDTAPINLDQTFTPCGGRIQVSPFHAQGGPSVGNAVSR
jgi:membrane-bound inhibitor of C-type lysozyme